MLRISETDNWQISFIRASKGSPWRFAVISTDADQPDRLDSFVREHVR